MASGAQIDQNFALLMALARTIQAARQRLLPLFAADGLTGGQFDTLRVLHHCGPLCVNELLGQTLSTSGNIDVVLDHLLDKKLVSKGPDPADGRRRIVALTAEGRRYIQKRFPAHVAELREFMSVLSVTEKRQLEGLLAKLGGRD